VRSWIGTGLLVAGVLALIAAVPLDRGASAGLALVAVTALAARTLSSLADVRRALGPFASPLDMTVELALALAGAWLTGGLRSPLLLVTAALLVLARRFHGLPAARFLSVATMLGLVVLAAVSPAAALERPLATAALVLWPLALLAAMELALPADAVQERSERTATPAAPVAPAAAATNRRPADSSPVPPASPTSAPRERDLRAEILHDIRSPLSVVKVYADLIAERARRGELPVDEHLANLASEIELMELLVDGPGAARDRRAALPNAAVDLVRLLGELSGRYRETHGEKVRIEMSAERPRVEVRADPVALQRVFRNVLDNALQYTPAGGAVRIRLWADAVHAHVVVSDTGMGMSAEERARAFDPAYRGRGAQALRADGRGLGLTLSRELVEAMGGSISLWSEQDRGAEVRVLLPVAAEMAS
jgi:signal transduction histidine kinase